MSDIRLFRLTGTRAAEITGSASALEKPLQTLIEANLGPLLAIRFLATEYPTGKVHGGRIDTLGLDENDCPVILEYKRSTGENVINQGLYYLDWLLDHRAEFEQLVRKQLGAQAAEAVDWDAPRLVCIAADFTKFDAHAVKQIGRNIDLVRYRRFGADLLLLELVNAVTADASDSGRPVGAVAPNRSSSRRKVGAVALHGPSHDPKSRPDWLPQLAPETVQLFESLDRYIRSLGDDVQRKDQKKYVAYKRLRNFATAVAQPKAKNIRLFLHLDPANYLIDGQFLRDVGQLGHWGTGALEILLENHEHLKRAAPYLEAAYEGSKGAR
ncbi:MAG: DUF91 domain-containing protein [Opitutae bacterium]|nr:DUF91 domain-containing protein [Opitutae bacterium]